MERKEEIKQAADSMGLWQSGAAMFQLGAEWADSHPREGLWDKDKVCEYLTEKCKGFILTAKDIEDLKKAMENDNKDLL